MATVGAIATGSLVSLATPSDAATTLVTLYEHENLGGTRHDFVTWRNGYVCSDTSNDVDASWDITGFMNDRATSFIPWASCWAMLYEHSGFTGATYGWSSGSGRLPASMNDRASSMRVT